MPNIALINELKERFPDPSQLQILYIGTRRGMERDLVAPLGVSYKGIFAGKLRRYFSWRNFVDFFKLPLGILQSFFALLRFRPQAIFCKGGYVCFPVAVAGWALRIPVILHESDVVPGLANSLSSRFASKICISFEETRQFLPARKASRKIVFTGNPVRRELLYGNHDDGREFTALTENLPVLLIMGGSQGADFINGIVWDNLDRLLTHYQVIHICGENNVKGASELVKRLPEKNSHHMSRYRAFSFVGREMKDLYAFTDLIICRSGAITLAEIGFFGKPAILIPLSTRASRGDQIDNARVFAKEHAAKVIEEDEYDTEYFFGAIAKLLAGADAATGQQPPPARNQPQRLVDASAKIIDLLLDKSKKQT